MKVKKLLMKEEISFLFNKCLSKKTRKSKEWIPNDSFWKMWEQKQDQILNSGFTLVKKKQGEFYVKWTPREKKHPKWQAAYRDTNKSAYGEISSKEYLRKNFKPKWTKLR